MALTTPTLFYVPAFDATDGYTFKFNAVGGAQVTFNKLTIRNNQTNTIVYSEKIESFKFEHTVPGSKLQNSIYYNAVITTFDQFGNESKPSIPIQFWCYETPVISFTNLPAGNVITNASFSFDFNYSQSDGEKLNSYIVNLYDANQDIVYTSKNQYVINGFPPYNGTYLFQGLQDNTVYYIELICETINGTIVKTPLTLITVRYSAPTGGFSIIEATNNCDEGYITIKSNVVLIEGECVPPNPIYIDDKEIDLNRNGAYVKYDKGYSINGDFTMRAWFRSPRKDSRDIPLINFNTLNEKESIKVYYKFGYEHEGDALLKCYIEVVVNSLGNDRKSTYYAYSNYLNILPSSDYYNLWVIRKNNLFQIDFVAV